MTADEPGQLEAHVQREPVIAVTQVDAGQLLCLVQPVVQRRPVQVQVFSGPLGVAGQVQVSLDGPHQVRIGAEQRQQPRVDAALAVLIQRDLREHAERAEVSPAGEVADSRNRRRHGRGQLRLPVGRHRGCETALRISDSGDEPRWDAVFCTVGTVPARQRGKYFLRDVNGRPVVVGRGHGNEQHAVIVARRLDQSDVPGSAAQFKHRLADLLTPFGRRDVVRAPHVHNGVRAIGRHDALLSELARRGAAQVGVGREQMREHAGAQPAREFLFIKQQPGVPCGLLNEHDRGLIEHCLVVDQEQEPKQPAPEPDRPA